MLFKILLLILFSILFFTTALAVDITQNITVTIIPNESEKVVINEFVVDPQTDWNNNSAISTSDEWFELYNDETTPVDLTNWTLVFNDSTPSGPSVKILSGSIPPKSYLVILNPIGSQNNNGQILLYDQYDRLIDSVTHGNWDDGNISDNAPDGNADSIFDECLARFPNAVDTDVDSEDFIKTICTYDSENNLTVLVPINITDLPPSTSCALETDDITVSAEINGTIASVFLALNTDGSWTNISLPGNTERTYEYTTNSSLLTGNSNISWQFFAENPVGEITYGNLNTLHINSMTSLFVDPSSPDGLNNWYVTEPIFSLDNPGANENQTFYEWDSVGANLYTGPFGLENIPNAPPIESAGILELRWWSNLMCGRLEPQQSQTFYIDLTNPLITNLLPENNSIIFDTLPTISALLDEIFAQNSGINHSSVIMSIDGSPVPANTTSSGLIDALISYTPDSDLSLGLHEVTVSATDNAGLSSQLSWTFEIQEPPLFEVTIYSPLDGIYPKRRLQFNITSSQESEKIEYKNYNDRSPRWKRLCRNCDKYGFSRKRIRSLNEGPNNVTIRATSLATGQVAQASFFLTTDSKKPRITKTSPRRGLTNGYFVVEFREQNPVSLFLTYGIPFDSRNAEVDLSSCTKKRGRTTCEINVSLTDFEDMEIEYFFDLTDIVGNVAVSRTRKVRVDTIPPQINSFNYTTDRRRVTFKFNITEENFDKVKYIDYFDRTPKWKTLCSRLRDNFCEKRKSFRRGNHTLDISAFDKAGNGEIVVEGLDFVVI